jgi:hypothetical protein
MGLLTNQMACGGISTSVRQASERLRISERGYLKSFATNARRSFALFLRKRKYGQPAPGSMQRCGTKYSKHVERAIRKAGATHIVWVSALDITDAEVREVESDLIETLNPTANLSRPVPPSRLQARTKEVLACIRETIHEHRSDGFQVILRDAAKQIVCR